LKLDEQAQQGLCLPLMFNVSTQTQTSKYYVGLLSGDQSVPYSTLFGQTLQNTQVTWKGIRNITTPSIMFGLLPTSLKHYVAI
jgi:hypothetical protein